MAPTVPKKRTTMRAKLAKAQSSTSSAAAPRSSAPSSRDASAGADSLFADTKRDRRQIKRSAFLGQIKSKQGSGGVTKRRRPSKKLVANLDSLAAALPELAGGEGAEEQHQPGKVRIKSLKSRPGALKRKEKLVRAETQNIGRNLAFLSGLDGGAGPGTGNKDAAAAPVEAAPTPPVTANRWAALRAHISGTMEQNPAFLPKEQ